MIKYISILILVAGSINAIDKTVFKNCSQIEFCTRLREHKFDDLYSADLNSIEIDNNHNLKIPLKNKNNELKLILALLENNKVRIKIQEKDKERFQLDDIIIVEELKSIPFTTSKIGSTSLTLLPTNNSYPHKVTIIAGAPFKIEVYYNDMLEVILDAEKFLMENTDKSKAFTFKVSFPDSQRLYGLHDHAFNMSLGNTFGKMDPFRLRNSDSWGYEADSPMALYGSRPVVIGHSKEKTSAIFLLNAAEQWIDVQSDNDNKPFAYFMVERASFDLFVFLGPNPKEFVRQFTTLTGRAHMPQIWTLGYHQCRFSYKSQDDVKNVVANLDKFDFPWDAIWLDGDHTNEYRWFQWNTTTFTDPLELFNNISATGRVAVAISDPHIKVDDSYPVYAGAKDKYFTKWENGSDYQADCWPGKSSWIDFMIKEASDYYSSWYSFEKFNGTTPTLAGIWNDMNEPAVFDDSTEKTMPWEVLHNGTVPHGDIHNIYGLLQTKATHKGLMDRDKGEKRPFILTRSNFAGSQRYAAVWTGDNSATWEHFANTYSECMTANMMGMVFCGADIGGFIGDPSDELLQRWFQGAVWLPFFREHSSRESKRREPFLFSEEVQKVLRNTLRLRYRHVPTFYTLFYEHTRYGDPIIRPLYYQYPDVDDKDTQVLVGTDIMGIAITKAGLKSVEVYFPGSSEYWYRIDDDSRKVYQGGQSIEVSLTIETSPVFYRAGSIIFRKDYERKSAVDAIHDPFTVYVNLNKSGEATGRLYVDDYYTFKYEKNNYLYIDVSYNKELNALHIESIDGDSTGLGALIGKIVINHIDQTDSTSDKIRNEVTTYEKTSDGIPLSSINIGEAITAQSKLIIKL